jgi:hypothetical protein
MSRRLKTLSFSVGQKVSRLLWKPNLHCPSLKPTIGIYPEPAGPISFTQILILFSHLHLCLLSNFFFQFLTVNPLPLHFSHLSIRCCAHVPFWFDHRNNITVFEVRCRSQWPCGLRRGAAAAPLLGLWVWITPGAWMSVSCECCVLSGRGLCDGLVTRPEESYRLWCVSQCYREAS